jgi:hypothetical protein
MSEIEIRRIVFGLEQAGLVELVRRHGTDGTRTPGPPPVKNGASSNPPQQQTQRPPPRVPPVQQSVVTRLIEKIRSL